MIWFWLIICIALKLQKGEEVLKCADCGRIYHSTDELKRVEEDRGEFWGMPAYETMYYCWCGSEDLEEVLEWEDDE